MFKICLRTFFVIARHFIIFVQKILWNTLPHRKPEIVELQKWDATKHQFILIYVGFSKSIDRYMRDFLTLFRERGAYIIFVTNYPSFNRDDVAPQNMDLFIDNKNQGYDFAQYQIATFYVQKNFGDQLPEKIVYANDSVFYLKNDRVDFVDRLLDKNFDFVGAFSCYTPSSKFHITSWLFSVSQNLFVSDIFCKYWNKLRPIKNKFSAIEEGEIALSQVIIKQTNKIDVIYHYMWLQSMIDKHLRNMSYHHISRIIGAIRLMENLTKESRLHFLSCNIWRVSQVHVFMLLVLLKEEFSFIKKDSFWAEFLDYGQLDYLTDIIREKYSDEIAQDIKMFFLRKGRFQDAPFARKLMTYVGMR